MLDRSLLKERDREGIETEADAWPANFAETEASDIHTWMFLILSMIKNIYL